MEKVVSTLDARREVRVTIYGGQKILIRCEFGVDAVGGVARQVNSIDNADVIGVSLYDNSSRLGISKGAAENCNGTE